MRAGLLWGLVYGLAISAGAQDFPKAEIFGGYSYGNFQVLSDRSSMNGWNASATVNIYKWFGLTTDFGGVYGGSATETLVLPTAPTPITETVHENLRAHTFMFGPQVTYRRSRIEPFAHFLIGQGRLGETLSINVTGCPIVLVNCFVAGSASSQADTAFTVGLGGGADYVLKRNLAWRVQADYLGLGSLNDVRISTGIVFRLGK